MDQPIVGDASKGRLFGMAIDNLVACFLALLVGSLLPEAMSVTWRTVLALGAYLAYYFIQEGAFATTLGKRLFGLGIYRVDGTAVWWDDAAIRTAFRILEVNPLLFGALPGAIAVSSSERHQRFGDRVAGTVVMKRALAERAFGAVAAEAVDDGEAAAPRVEGS